MHAEQEYQNCLPIINKMVYHHTTMSQVDQDELRSQANLLFVLACQRYDDKRGTQFFTYFYHTLRLGLLTFVQKEKKELPIEPDEMTRLSDAVKQWQDRHENLIWFHEWVESLSPDSQVVVKLILTPPRALMNLSRGRHTWEGLISKSLLTEYLKDNRKWTRGQVLSAFREIKTKLKECRLWVT